MGLEALAGGIANERVKNLRSKNEIVSYLQSNPDIYNDALIINRELDSGDIEREREARKAIVSAASKQGWDALKLFIAIRSIGEIESLQTQNDIENSSKKDRYTLGASADLEGVSGLLESIDTTYTPPDYLSLDDFLPSGGVGGVIDKALDELIANSVIPDNLNLAQKKALLLMIGDYGNSTYSDERAKDITSGKKVSLDEFLDNTGRLRDVERASENIKKLQSLAQDVNEEAIRKYLRQTAKAAQVSVENVEKIWEASNGDIEVFESKIIEKYFTIGICRDIATFQMMLMHDLGFQDPFITSNSYHGVAHAISGFRDTDGTITFLNYSQYLPTKTRNMTMALKVLEDYNKSIALTYIQGTPSKETIIIKSAAAESLGEMVRGRKDFSSVTGDSITTPQDLELKTPGLKFKVEKGVTALELREDFLAGGVFVGLSYHRHEQDPENSIGNAIAVRTGMDWESENFGVGASGAYARIGMKSMDKTGRIYLNKALLRIYGETHTSVDFSPSLQYKMAASAEAIVDWSLNHPSTEDNNFSSALGAIVTDQKLAFIGHDLKLYVGLETKSDISLRDIQSAGATPADWSFAHDLLKARFGVKVGAGSLVGHKVDIAGEVAGGSRGFSFTEGEDLGKTLSAGGAANFAKNGNDLGIDLNGEHATSKDFRLDENVRGIVNAYYGSNNPNGGYWKISLYGFYEKSLGENRDSRLDDKGVGLTFRLED